MDKAVEAAGKAIQLDPQNARCYASLGRTLCQMGRYPEAKENLETAIKLAPDKDYYREDLEQVLDKLK